MPVALRRRHEIEKDQEPPAKSRKNDPPQAVQEKTIRSSRQQPNLTEKCTTAAKPVEKINVPRMRITRQQPNQTEKCTAAAKPLEKKNVPRSRITGQQIDKDQKPRGGTNPPEQRVQPSQSRVTRQQEKMAEKPRHSRVTRQQKNEAEEKGLTCKTITEVNREDRDNMIEESRADNENGELTLNFHPISSSTFIQEQDDVLTDLVIFQTESINIQQHQISETTSFDSPLNLEEISEKVTVMPSIETVQYNFQKTQIQTVEVFKHA